MRFVRSWADSPDSLDIQGLRDAVSVDAVEFAVLFGSFARNDAGSLSDLDVAIRFESDVGHHERGQLLDELTVAIQKATDIEAVDLVDLDGVGPDVGYEALASGVLVCGDRDAATDLEAELLLRALDFEPVKRTWQAALDDRLREGTFGRP